MEEIKELLMGIKIDIREVNEELRSNKKEIK